jgi:hypothetical protein
VSKTKELKKRCGAWSRRINQVRFGKSRLTRAALPFSAERDAAMKRLRIGLAGVSGERSLTVRLRLTSALVPSASTSNIKNSRASGTTVTPTAVVALRVALYAACHTCCTEQRRDVRLKPHRF